MEVVIEYCLMSHFGIIGYWLLKCHFNKITTVQSIDEMNDAEMMT